MARYLPFAGKNAIVEMNIGLQFSSPFDARVGESLEAIKAEFAAEFTKFEPLQTITINIGVQQFPMAGTGPAPAMSGFTLTKVKADGSPARVLRAMTSVLSVHFLEYDSWKETKSQAVNYITRCLERLAILDHNAVTSVLLRYIDRFTFDGAPEQATAGELFRPDSKFVISRLLDRGYQWHCNSGWFEPLVGTTLALSQLNMTSGMIQAAVGVIVDHNSVCTFPRPCSSVAELTQGDGERPSLEVILDLQHAANASLLRNLLNQEMLDTIGL